MCLRDVFGYFTLVADCTPMVSCDGRALRYHLRWSVQCQLHLLHNRLLTYNRKDIDLSRTWPPILGTPVDPEPNIRWYLNDQGWVDDESDRRRHRGLSLSNHLPYSTGELEHRPWKSDRQPSRVAKITPYMYVLEHNKNTYFFNSTCKREYTF